MAHVVIEVLEIIDIDEEYAHMALILRSPPQRMVEQNEQLPAIRKMSERIVFRQMLQLTRPLLDFLLEPLLIVAGYVSCDRELRGHAVEAGAQGVQFLDAAPGNTYVHIAAGNSLGG